MRALTNGPREGAWVRGLAAPQMSPSWQDDFGPAPPTRSAGVRPMSQQPRTPGGSREREAAAGAEPATGPLSDWVDGSSTHDGGFG